MIDELNYKQYSDFLNKAELMLSDFWDSEWARKKKANMNKIFAMYDDFIEKKAAQDQKVKQEYKKVQKFLSKMEESANILKAVKMINFVIGMLDDVCTTLTEDDKQTLNENAQIVDQYFKPGSAEKIKAMTDGFENGSAETDPENTEEQNEEMGNEYRAILALGSILSVLGEEYFVANEVKPELDNHMKDLNDYVMFREIERFNFMVQMDRDELNHNIAKFLYTTRIKAELINSGSITRERINESRSKWGDMDEAVEEMLSDPKMKEFIERFGMKSSNKQILKELKEFTKGEGEGGGHGIHAQELERRPEQRQQRQPERNIVPGH